MIAGIVLAAGGSARLGRPKQLVPVKGKPLVRRAAEALREGGCRPVLVVLGAAADEVAGSLDGLDVELRSNPDWRDGLAGSIRVGVESLAGRDRVQGVLLAACDQPGLDAALVADLIRAFDGRPGRIVASAYAGTLGTPAVFERSLFDELLALGGDVGARSVIAASPARVLSVDWPAGATDVDTVEDLQDLEEREDC